jgi:hypothetical protein
MITLIIEFALFLLVMFFVLPSLLIALMIVRELIHQQRKQAGSQQKWRRSETAELAG